MLDFYSRQPSANSHERSIEVEIQAKQATVKGPMETFTGHVWFDVITRGEDYARMHVNVVRFAPSARTAWHAHPGGQTLYVTEGRGLVQSRGGEILEIRPGDVIYTPPGEWHWHGAAPDHFMTHIAMWEIPVNTIFYRNIGVRGGPSPVRHYVPELLHDVLDGRIEPGRVFDFETDLDHIAEAYAAMDERRAVKSLLRMGSV